MEKSNKKRPPIVSVLGHVDHGKTSLLDAIRNTKVADREAGGITQSIGASNIKTKSGSSITFIDTPGHAAFSKMRVRGADVADVVVLVVASDDGVMPQTKEAISYIKEASVPYVVALTKTDLPGANLEKAKASLETEGVFLEGRGGDIPAVSVSSKTGEGLEDLLEMIILLSDVSGILGSSTQPFSAVVIETGKDKRGHLVSIVVKSGILKVGDMVGTEHVQTKVRGLFDGDNISVKEISAGMPALILGFSDLPEVGAVLKSVEKKDSKDTEKRSSGDTRSKNTVGIPIMIKAENQGVLEAIEASIPDGVFVVNTSLGDVTESDVFMAKASNARILTFEAKVPGTVKRLSDTESVKIESFKVIYEMFKYIEELVDDSSEKVLAKAKILQTFSYKGVKKVAGCKITEGEITKSSSLVVERGDKRLGVVKALSIKKNKTEVGIVKKGEEFGIYFEPQLDFAVGDMLLSVAKPKIS